MKKFPLLNAPDRAVDLIIGLMDLKEQVKLTLCSVRAGDSVKRTKPDMKGLEIEIGSRQGSALRVLPNAGISTVMFSISFHEQFKTNHFLMTTLLGIPIEEYQMKSDDPGLGAVHLAQRLYSVFNVEQCHYIIYVIKADLKNILTRAVVLPHDTVMVNGYHNSSNDFRFLMDYVDLNAYLIIRSLMPNDFRYEKALKFKSIDYQSADWVPYEDLISLRNKKKVILRKTSLNIRDINNFLLYWINCEEEMVELFKITLKEGNDLNEKDVLASLVCTFGNNRNGFHCAIMARNTEKRKRILGKLTIAKESQSVTFQTFEDNEESRDTLKALENVQRHKDMRMEIRELEKKEIEKRKIYDEMEDGNPMKEGVKEEIERISNEIKEKENKMNGVRILLLGTQFRYAIP